MADAILSLPDRAAQLVADLEHASASNAPVTPVMLRELRDLVTEAIGDKTASDAGLAAALNQSQRAIEIARRVQAEAADIAGAIGEISGTS